MVIELLWHGNVNIMDNPQAHSQACFSGVAKLSLGSHVLQNLRPSFIYHVVPITWIVCVQFNQNFRSFLR